MSYRMLTEGERIKVGDEYFLHGEWLEVTAQDMGESQPYSITYDPSSKTLFRRLDMEPEASSTSQQKANISTAGQEVYVGASKTQIGPIDI
ncbi:MAG: hypothetical protein ACRBHB_15110 [Arenicella sp.]